MEASAVQKVRVRFAPSPTGPLSIGNVRTALFNWLYARHTNGKFLLRIEDTDKGRSKPEFEAEILEGLTWLGLNWDEAPVKQSTRKDIYERYITQLLSNRKAYYCFCTPEELDTERQARLSQGMPPIYVGTCKDIPAQEAATRAAKQPSVIRFHVPPGIIEFSDIIRGKVSFKAELVGDFIIAKDTRTPLYNFAVVVDDHEMEITHIIRGEDHLSNTPRQILLQRALEFPEPHYAHVPLILGRNKKKLSKRDLEHSFLEYRDAGYLPDAVINFLVLLGWHPKEDKEVISKEEVIETFSLKRVQKGGAVFDKQKLEWLNAHYINAMPAEELLSHMQPFIPDSWMQKKELVLRALRTEKERMKRLTEFKDIAGFFFELPTYDTSLLIWNDSKETSIENLRKVYEFLEQLSEELFDRERIEPFLADLSDETSRGEVYWPLRVALSGKKASPGALDIIEVIGHDETLKRITYALEKEL